MAKGYWIVRLDVQDGEAFKRYQAVVGSVIERHGGRYLIRGGQHAATEGSARNRNVVVEFPSYRAAIDCYHSAEYAEPLAIRKAAADSDFLVIEGVEDA